jgi:lysophospholipase L1-like esterase
MGPLSNDRGGKSNEKRHSHFRKPLADQARRDTLKVCAKPAKNVMTRRDWTGLLLQTLLIAGAVVAAISLDTMWSAVAGMTLLGITLIALQAAPRIPWPSVWPPGWSFASGFGMLVWMGLLLTTLLFDPFFAAVAALISMALAVTSRRTAAASRNTRWKILILAWLGCLNFIWIMTGYDQNARGAFYSGLLSILALLVLCRLWFRLGPIGLQIVNTFLLLLIGLTTAGLIYQFHGKPEVRPETFRNYCSYEKAKGNPEAFARAQAFYNHCWGNFEKQFFERTHRASPFLRLRPNSHGYFMQCPISINSKGFRGREIAGEKGGIYRIVALGESTTFGMTCEPDDKPWPELLEQMIRERLKTRRPVEVINAGTPGYSLRDNLRTLPGHILPLKPDMIISYHGANGFNLIDETLLGPVGAAAPPYMPRPLKLAADFEYRIKVMRFLNRERKALHTSPAFANPLETIYAEAYRQLIHIAATNNIRLMLANYSMPVTGKSDPAVIDFYQGGNYDSVRGRIKANMIHSLILQQLAGQHPEVCLIDTHPHLDGEHEKFIDLMHFTQEGRRQLAENIFAGIRKTLETDTGRQEGDFKL